MEAPGFREDAPTPATHDQVANLGFDKAPGTPTRPHKVIEGSRFHHKGHEPHEEKAKAPKPPSTRRTACQAVSSTH